MELEKIDDGVLTDKILIGLDLDDIDIKSHMVEHGDASRVGFLSKSLDFLLLLASTFGLLRDASHGSTIDRSAELKIRTYLFLTGTWPETNIDLFEVTINKPAYVNGFFNLNYNRRH